MRLAAAPPHQSGAASCRPWPTITARSHCGMLGDTGRRRRGRGGYKSRDRAGEARGRGGGSTHGLSLEELDHLQGCRRRHVRAAARIEVDALDLDEAHRLDLRWQGLRAHTHARRRVRELLTTVLVPQDRNSGADGIIRRLSPPFMGSDQLDLTDRRMVGMRTRARVTEW